MVPPVLGRATLNQAQLRAAASTLVDQGVVSAGTLLIHVLLARFTEPTEYGIFVLGYSAIVLATELHHALLLEPMAIFGTRKRGAESHEYFGASLIIQLGFTTSLMLLVWLVCVTWLALAGEQQALTITALMPLGLLGVQLREFTRRTFYARLEPARALRNDLLYLVLLLAGLALAALVARFGAGSAFLVIGLAGTGSAAVGLGRLGVQVKAPRPAVVEVTQANWRYGRWMIASAGARWSTGEMYYWVVAMFLGPAGAAALRAVQNLFAPVSLLLTGLGNVLLPAASRLADGPSTRRLNSFLATVSGVLGAVVLIYSVTVALAATPLFSLLYGGRYAEYANLIPLIGAGSVLTASLQGTTIGLRALNQPRSVFFVSMLSAIVSAAVVFPLTVSWGLVGALLAWVTSLAAAVPFWVGRYRRAARAHRAASPLQGEMQAPPGADLSWLPRTPGPM